MSCSLFRLNNLREFLSSFEETSANYFIVPLSGHLDALDEAPGDIDASLDIPDGLLGTPCNLDPPGDILGTPCPRNRRVSIQGQYYYKVRFKNPCVYTLYARNNGREL